MKENDLCGWFLVNKPVGLSSRKTGNLISRKINAQKFGHIGTLDPNASGLLPILINDATRFAFGLEKADKSYRATIQFGWSSTTDDSEGDISFKNYLSAKYLNYEFVNQQLQEFIGEIWQIPPAYSAIRVSGQRLYQKMRHPRKTKEYFQSIKIPPKLVKIYAIQLEKINFEKQSIVIKIDCGSGTYIRSIARELGEKLGCGGYILTLERIILADFNFVDSVNFKNFENTSNEEIIKKYLRPADQLTKNLIPIKLSNLNCKKILNGQKVNIEKNKFQAAKMQKVRLYSENDKFIGIGIIDQEYLIASRLLPIQNF